MALGDFHTGGVFSFQLDVYLAGALDDAQPSSSCSLHDRLLAASIKKKGSVMTLCAHGHRLDQERGRSPPHHPLETSANA